MTKYNVVELRNISKTFPGSEKKANNNISLDLHSGEILCIAGENGAGKTTLMKILCGLEKQDSGEIIINGRQVHIDTPLDVQKLGIGMVHQHFMLLPEWTVAENIALGTEPRKWGLFLDSSKARNAAAGIIQEHHFSISPDMKVNSLSIGEKQQVEICRLLYRNANIIILDEPTSLLTEREAASFLSTLKVLAAAGKSLVLITHKLHEIKQVSGRVAVLRQGELIDIQNTAEIDEHEIAGMMIGPAAEEIFIANNSTENSSVSGAASKTAGDEKEACKKPVIVFDNVTVMRHGQKQALLDRVSFCLYPGEILGFAGVGGNGLGVLEAVLGGFLHPVSGKIFHRGVDISRLNIRKLRNRGLAYIPADRLGVGSAQNAAIDENFIINRRAEFSRMGFLDYRTINHFTGNLIRHYNIAHPGIGKSAASLSGGNLQKLILAREIEQFKDYIVFSEPCWGLDFASTANIHRQIAALREKGAAIILISTNLDEILELADRTIVMYRGKIAGNFANNTAIIKEKIGACMQGLSADISPDND